jgi:hypothetical protein
MVEFFFKNLEYLSLSDSMPITSIDDVLITLLRFTAIATCCCLFKIGFAPFNSVKLLLPTYKLREWTRQSEQQTFKHLSKEMEPLEPLKEVESNISPKSTTAVEMPSKYKLKR